MGQFADVNWLHVSILVIPPILFVIGALHTPVEAIPMYVEELLLLLTCYVEGTS